MQSRLAKLGPAFPMPAFGAGRPVITDQSHSARRPGGSEGVHAGIARTTPAVLDLLGDGIPRSKRTILATLVGQHHKDDVLRTLMRLAVTGRLVEQGGKLTLPPPDKPAEIAGASSTPREDGNRHLLTRQGEEAERGAVPGFPRTNNSAAPSLNAPEGLRRSTGWRSQSSQRPRTSQGHSRG